MIPFKDWAIDYVALAKVFTLRRSYVADIPTMRGIFANLADALGTTAEEIEKLCKLEVGFPTDYDLYRSSMRGGAGNHYVGPTQIGSDFWKDVITHKPSLKLPANRVDATLEMQIAAPYIYADRYRKVMESKNYPFDVAFVYALHQQGSGAATLGFPRIAGTQSKRSIPVVKSVQHFTRTGNYRPVEI